MVRGDVLTEPERSLLAAMATGEVADMAGQEVRGGVLATLLTDERAHAAPPRALSLVNAHVVGEVDAADVAFLCGAEFHACRFDRVILEGARATRLALTECELLELFARRLEVVGDLVLHRTKARAIDLDGAILGGSLVLAEGRLGEDAEQRALSASDVAVRGGVRMDGLVAKRSVHLVGAQIGADLSLVEAQLGDPGHAALEANGVQVRGNLLCSGLRTAGMVSLKGAAVGGGATFSDAILHGAEGFALDADRIVVDGGLDLSRAQVTGEVRLAGARVRGAFSASQARAAGTSGRALTLEAAEVDTVFCTELHADGSFVLTRASIGGLLGLDQCEVTALAVDDARVAGDVVCRRLQAEGLSLRGARVDGRITVGESRIGAREGLAVAADGLEVARGVTFADTVIRGAADFSGAMVAADLHLRTAEIHGDSAYLALGLRSARVGELVLPSAAPQGLVDLTDANVERLVTPDLATADGSDLGYRVRLGGFVDQSIGRHDFNLDARLAWIANAQEGYSPALYKQVERALREAGADEDARRVAIEMHRRSRAVLSRPARFVNRLFELTVGYGYRTQRALYALIALVVVGWGLFAWASWDHLRAVRPPDERPEFEPLLYSLDVVVPVVDFGQQAAWAPTGLLQVWYAASALVGFVLASALFAALTAVLFRERNTGA